jgi:hypothetical protein
MVSLKRLEGWKSMKEKKKGIKPKNFELFLNSSHNPEVWKKIGLSNAISQKGYKQTTEHKKNISKSHRGIMPKNINLLIQKAIRFKKGERSKGVIFTKENTLGEKNPNWKGGITPLNLMLRTSSIYAIWREAVFLRDNFTCQNPNCEYCHNKLGILLNAHHIKPFSLYPDLRFDINNGVTYCAEYHLNSKLHNELHPNKVNVRIEDEEVEMEQ